MKKQILITSALVLLALAGGYLLGRGRGGHDHAAVNPPAGAKIKFWTCSMHPQIRQPTKGKCKICGMDLIPVMEGQDANLGPRQLMLSASAARLADVQVAPVVREMPMMNVRMAGKIETDESRVAYITARFPGRLDKLFVDYTGVMVKKGDHLAEIYSPDLLTAQQELIQARHSVVGLEKSAVPAIRERAQATLDSARRKLALWDLTPGQIDQIESSGKPTDHVTLYAPISGVVIHKEAVEGIYLNTGGRIYTIADLSTVWVKLDAYESDLQWIHFGQAVEFETEAYPGRKFSGRIAFIDPVLNPKTRTVKVRVNVENPDGRLKPEMFVRAVVRSRIASDGPVMDPVYAGKWISPMHPEIVRDKPGPCPVCGMALVRAESLGYAPATGGTNAAPIVIPITAPLTTGERAVVYVTTTNQPGVFEGREITLGPRAGEVYIVKEGLRDGELVVVNGNFKIDSAIQILAKPSMMNPEEGAGGKGPGEKPVMRFETSAHFRRQFDQAVAAYLAIHQGLAADRLPTVDEMKRLDVSLRAIDIVELSEEARDVWMGLLNLIQRGQAGLRQANALPPAREAFEHLSKGFIGAGRQFGSGQTLYVQECFMAFGKRAGQWLDNVEELRNPYLGLGSGMIKCGVTKEKFEGQETEGAGRGAGAAKSAPEEKEAK